MKAWYRILEKYYREVDESSYVEFVTNLKKSTYRQNEMYIIESAWILASFGSEAARKILDENKITSKSKFLQFKTKYNMFLAKEKSKSKPTSNIDFYEILGDIAVSEKISLNSEMHLPEWIGILRSVKKSAELRKKRNNEPKK